MQKIISALLMVLSLSSAAGCGEFRDRDRDREFRNREFGSREDTPANRKARAERIFPEDGDFTGAHIAALIEAIRTVRPDIPKEELPLNGNAVRHVLQGMSVRDLDRVEAILPRIIKRRQAEGAN
jgi:hypothetical protein